MSYGGGGKNSFRQRHSKGHYAQIRKKEKKQAKAAQLAKQSSNPPLSRRLPSIEELLDDDYNQDGYIPIELINDMDIEENFDFFSYNTPQRALESLWSIRLWSHPIYASPKNCFVNDFPLFFACPFSHTRHKKKTHYNDQTTLRIETKHRSRCFSEGFWWSQGLECFLPSLSRTRHSLPTLLAPKQVVRLLVTQIKVFVSFRIDMDPQSCYNELLTRTYDLVHGMFPLSGEIFIKIPKQKWKAHSFYSATIHFTSSKVESHSLHPPPHRHTHTHTHTRALPPLSLTLKQQHQNPRRTGFFSTTVTRILPRSSKLFNNHVRTPPPFSLTPCTPNTKTHSRQIWFFG